VDASDIVQDTFRQALKGFPKFRGVTKREFCGWLGKIHSHNVFQAVQAGQKRPRVGSLERDDSLGQAEPEADQTSPSICYMRLEAQERLHHLLEQLPDVQREAVMLRFLEALPVQEIARRLGKTHQAVGGLLRRGMGKLREFATLSQEPGGEP